MQATAHHSYSPLDHQSDRPCIVASFKAQQQVDDVVKRLLDCGIPRCNISAIGKNFQSETRIAGFLTKRDVVLDGLKSGAIFGSLFGTFLSLLSGVGVLFVPFVGPVVAAGPLGAALLGATSGAIAGSAGAGLASVLATLGMPHEQATLYETRVQSGEFLLVVEVQAEQSSEVQRLLRQSGGEDVFACDDMLIPRQPDGLLEAPTELSPDLRSRLSEDAQQTFIWAYNEAFLYSQDSEDATLKAWEVVEETYQKDDSGRWSSPSD